jgi:7,8-dihydropterin-6-yl-methyl-4-(beta-D-ribofuranosyl)aminobenzene 5'-phosphate synthase
MDPVCDIIQANGSYALWTESVRLTMKITCIVDDRAQPDSGLKAEHGIGFLIETDGQMVLFDTGQSAQVLLHNLTILGFDPEKIGAIIISHAHYDHTGGLPGLLEAVQDIPLYAHPDLFRERFRKTDTGPKSVGPSLDRAALDQGFVLNLGVEPQEVAPGVWTTGEIAPRPEPEGRSRYHIVRKGRKWIADPYQDDLAVVLKTESDLVLICGCCHAGLLNTIAHVRRTFGENPVAVVGGTHLVSANTPTMNHIIEELQRCGPPQLWLGHCTGQRGFLTLKAAFGDLVSLCQAGTVLEF